MAERENIFGKFLFPNLFRTFRISIHHSQIFAALLGLALIVLTGRLMDIHKTVVVTSYGVTELDTFVLEGPAGLDVFVESHQKSVRLGVFETLWKFMTEHFHGIVKSILVLNLSAAATNTVEIINAIGWAFRYQFFYTSIFFLIFIAVTAAMGGVICRIAALQFAIGEKPGLGESLRFGFKKFFNFFAAPLVPVFIIVCIGIPLIILGLIYSIPYAGDIVMAVFLPLAILIGMIMAIIAIGGAVGFTLMFPSMAYENSDCFDAISQSYEYIYTQPWRFVFYGVLTAVYGAVCYIFVRFFTFSLMLLTYLFIKLGLIGDAKMTQIWPRPEFMNVFNSALREPAANWGQSFASFFVHLWGLIIIGIVISFLISFYFTATTIIYALLRYKIDKTPIDKIYMQAQRFEGNEQLPEK
ncbi:MAG: hypothetical protein PHF37_10985 [Phycisphaerae bacterium]|nr:hypothetical protein [Phycisphaerae bacterium]